MKSVYQLIFLSIGFFSVFLFHFDIFFPVWFSIAVFVAVSLFIWLKYRHKCIGILMLLLWLVYALPFIHIIPYLWFDFDYADPVILWGLAINPYMLDEQIIQLTAMIGAVGGLGIAFGVALHHKRIIRDPGILAGTILFSIRALPFSVWLLWVSAGVVLSWLAAPQDTILTAAYTTSESILQNANFGSAWMISYVFLSFALCDSILDRHVERGRLKRRVVLGAMIFVVVFLQLLRGDRESIPFVFSALLVYFYWAAPFTQQRQTAVPWLKIIIGGFILVLVSMLFGAFRGSLVGIGNFGDFFNLVNELLDSEQIGASNLLHGTWSAVLLTPLSVAGDHIEGLLALKLGQTYLDLFLSIPPGFVADAIGYSRPIDSLAGPAWEMRYGIGGTHASVVPFMNFRMAGVFIVPAIWAFALARYEKGALKKLSVINLSLLCTISLAAPHWLWYGEKNGFNAFIIWALLAVLYRVSLSIRRRPVDISKNLPPFFGSDNGKKLI